MDHFSLEARRQRGKVPCWAKLLVFLLILIAGASYWYFGVQLPRERARLEGIYNRTCFPAHSFSEEEKKCVQVLFPECEPYQHVMEATQLCGRSECEYEPKSYLDKEGYCRVS
mmetsp:Transcript_33344/g.51105  ORF Transcript_33344/g.51105 Transcript_33344/m.51105 type:complete len:113 (-) Transcript_33344:442-780(-)